MLAIRSERLLCFRHLGTSSGGGLPISDSEAVRRLSSIAGVAEEEEKGKASFGLAIDPPGCNGCGDVVRRSPQGGAAESYFVECGYCSVERLHSFGIVPSQTSGGE